MEGEYFYGVAREGNGRRVYEGKLSVGLKDEAWIEDEHIGSYLGFLDQLGRTVFYTRGDAVKAKQLFEEQDKLYGQTMIRKAENELRNMKEKYQ